MNIFSCLLKKMKKTTGPYFWEAITDTHILSQKKKSLKKFGCGYTANNNAYMHK